MHATVYVKFICVLLAAQVVLKRKCPILHCEAKYEDSSADE
jgi:hypothetical protein